MNYILDLLDEPSTWAGMLKFASGAWGLTLTTSWQTQIIAAGVGLAGLVQMLFKDRAKLLGAMRKRGE